MRRDVGQSVQDTLHLLITTRSSVWYQLELGSGLPLLLCCTYPLHMSRYCSWCMFFYIPPSLMDPSVRTRVGRALYVYEAAQVYHVVWHEGIQGDVRANFLGGFPWTSGAGRHALMVFLSPVLSATCPMECWLLFPRGTREARSMLCPDPGTATRKTCGAGWAGHWSWLLWMACLPSGPGERPPNVPWFWFLVYSEL